MPITLDGTLGITTPALTVTGATVNTGGISTAGNLTFTSTGQRILGDFSNGTPASRVFFQTSTTNSNTVVSAMPNGTGSIALFDTYNSSDPNNSSLLRIRISSTEAKLENTITGTGTYLPMVFNTGGSERMRIDTSGNVGIGTSAPSAKLELSGTTTAVAQKLTATTGPAYTVYGNTGSNLFIGKENSAGGGFGAPAYASIFYEQGAYPQIFYTTSTERMRIDASGNVGIGGASGGAKLQITSAGAGGQLTLVTATNGGVLVNDGTVTTILYNTSSSNGSLGTTSNHPFAFYTNNAERMRISSTGQVCVGATTSVGNAGSIYSAVGGGSNLLIEKSTGASIAFYQSGVITTLLEDISSQGGLRIYTGTGGSVVERFRITNTGNVQLITGGTSILNSSSRPMVNQTGGTLQVVQGTTTSNTSTSSTSYVNTTLSATITPSSTSSKILIQMQTQLTNTTNAAATAIVAVFRGATELVQTAYENNGSGGYSWVPASVVYLDSPAANTATTYQVKLKASAGTAYFCLGGNTNTLILTEIAG